MTDIIETHGPQGAAMETVGRRPWRAPRLKDLDDIETERARMSGPAWITVGGKYEGFYEGRTTGGAIAVGTGS